MKSSDSDISATITFTSSDYNTQPPTGSFVNPCEPNIYISEIDVKISGPVSAVLSVFEGSIRRTVEQEMNDFACEELKSLGSESVQDFIQDIYSIHTTYLNPLPPSRSDPLYAENNINNNSVAPGTKLLRLKNVDNFMGEWIRIALDTIDSMLGSLADDIDSPTGTGQDFVINTMLRSSVLDSNRVFVLRTVDILKDLRGDAIIFTSNDLFTDTTIELTEVRLLGLDTITKFDPLECLGEYTLSSSIQWEFLKFEIDLTIVLKASSHSSSVIIDSDGNVQTEYVTLELGANGISFDFDFLLAFDQDKLGNLRFGSLFQTDQIFSCVMSAVHRAEVTKLIASVSDVPLPKFKGFISEGVSRIVTNASHAVFDMYDQPFLHILPTVTQLDGRDAINNAIYQFFSNATTNLACHSISGNNTGLIDFRDLFLFPNASSAMGGSGTEPYGDTIPFFKDILNDQLLAINDLIASATKSQSGIEGTFHLTGTFLNFNTSDTGLNGVDEIQFSISDIRIRDIDSFGSPLTLLQPNNTDPHVLDNNIAIGTTDERSLTITGRLLLEINGDPSLAMQNELDIEMDVGHNASLIMSIMAKIEAAKFLDFPIEDLLNLNCWLALFPTPPSLDVIGMRSNGTEPSLAVPILDLFLSELSLNVTCLSCSSPGFTKLQEVIELQEAQGIYSELKDRILSYVETFTMGSVGQTYIDRILADAPFQCPHDPSFDVNYSSVEYEAPRSDEALSEDLAEILAISSAAALQAGIGVIANNFTSVDFEATDPLSRERNLNFSDEVNLFNLNDLRSIDGGLIDRLNRFRPIAMNLLVRSFLDDDRALTFLLNDTLINVGDVSIVMKSFRIFGLDSLRAFELISVIGDYTMFNNFQWRRIIGQANIDLVTPRGVQELKLELIANDVDTDVSVLFAIDEDIIANTELESILDTVEAIPCLFSAARILELTQWVLTAGSLGGISISGLDSEEEVSNLVSSSTSATYNLYETMLVESLPHLFDGAIRTLFNGDLQSFFECVESTRRLLESQTYADLGDLLLEHALDPLLKGLDDDDERTLKKNKVLVEPTRSNGTAGFFVRGVSGILSGVFRVSAGALNMLPGVKTSFTTIENPNTEMKPTNTMEDAMCMLLIGTMFLVFLCRFVAKTILRQDKSAFSCEQKMLAQV